MRLLRNGRATATDRRIFAEQTRQLYSHVPISMIGTIVNGAILVVFLWEVTAPAVLLGWYAVALAVTTSRYLVWFAYGREPRRSGDADLWFRLLMMGVVAAGLVWGSATVLLFAEESIVHQVFLAFVIAGMAAGGMTAYSVRMDTYYLFVLPLLIPMALMFFLVGGRIHLAMAFMTGLFGLIISSTARRIHQTLTASIQLTFENDDLLDSLRIEKENAEAASKAKSSFLANMSHELRTPLNGITGLADLLSMTEQTAEQQEYTANIKTSASVLCTLIGDVLDFSKIEAGKLHLENAPFSLRRLMEEISTLFARPAFAKGIDFGCLVKNDVPDRLIGDPGRLRQILSNLTGNAVKYTDTGQVAVYISLKEMNHESVHLDFRVADTGIGISESQQQELFQPFIQADSSTTKIYGGTGLGLAISRQLVALMRGDPIRIDSRPGQGSEFSFGLTLALDAAGHPGDNQEPGRNDLSDLAVLLAGGDTITMKIMAEHLSGWDCNLETARDMTTAGKQLQNGPGDKPAFDLILVDTSGDTIKAGGLVALIHLHDDTAGVPVLLTTDSRGSHDALENQVPATGYITKPIKKEKLRENILAATTKESFSRIGPAVEPAVESAPTAVSTGRHPDSSRENTGTGRAPLRILVAEDNRLSRRIVRIMLEKMGHIVTAVDNGRDAVRQCRDHAFDLVLMDGQMPVMDGLAATREIRRMEARLHPGQRVPIIAVTAHAVKGDRETFLAAGMDDYISKPIKQSTMAALIRSRAGRGRTP